MARTRRPARGLVPRAAARPAGPRPLTRCKRRFHAGRHRDRVAGIRDGAGRLGRLVARRAGGAHRRAALSAAGIAAGADRRHATIRAGAGLAMRHAATDAGAIRARPRG